jgi:hypothetical protein
VIIYGVANVDCLGCYEEQGRPLIQADSRILFLTVDAGMCICKWDCCLIGIQLERRLRQGRQYILEASRQFFSTKPLNCLYVRCNLQRNMTRLNYFGHSAVPGWNIFSIDRPILKLLTPQVAFIAVLVVETSYCSV